MKHVRILSLYESVLRKLSHLIPDEVVANFSFDGVVSIPSDSEYVYDVIVPYADWVDYNLYETVLIKNNADSYVVSNIEKGQSGYVVTIKSLNFTELVVGSTTFTVDKKTPDEEQYEIVSNYILEVMYELEYCFKIADTEGASVGVEKYYTLSQKKLISSIVAYDLLVRRITEIASTASSSTETPVDGVTILKKAKAGTAEVEFEQVDTEKSASLGLGTELLLGVLSDEIKKLASSMGCNGRAGGITNTDIPLPLLVTKFNDCC